MCEPGLDSCGWEGCDTVGNDEGFSGIVCSDEATGALEAFTVQGSTGEVTGSCPTGMWALWGYNWHFTTNTALDCDAGCCQRSVTGRDCVAQTYSAWGETLVNPAGQCSGAACNHGGSEAQTLQMLCVCLPGHARLDPSGGCDPCDLGQRPDENRESCVDCAEGTYCSRPDREALPCGGNDVYCPPKTHTPITVSTGYYSVGGTPMNRTGQAPCRVRVLVCCGCVANAGVGDAVRCQ